MRKPFERAKSWVLHQLEEEQDFKAFKRMVASNCSLGQCGGDCSRGACGHLVPRTSLAQERLASNLVNSPTRMVGALSMKSAEHKRLAEGTFKEIVPNMMPA